MKRKRHLRQLARVGLPVLALSATASTTLHAQPPRPVGAETPAPSAELDDLSDKVQNPVSDLISLPFQNNTNFDIGPYHRASNVLNIQPILPVSVTGEWNVINRVILPIAYQPDVNQATDGVNGVGDINATFWASPARPGPDVLGVPLLWGVG